MPLDILITTNRLATDPIGRDFVDYLRVNAVELNLDDGIVYYDFPTYSDYDTVAHKPDALVVSRSAGIFAVRFFSSAMLPLSNALLSAVDESLAQFCSILIGRLLKSRTLRSSLSTLSFGVTPVLFAPGAPNNSIDPEFSRALHSLQGFQALLNELSGQHIDDAGAAEIRSVIEGAKALARPQKRQIENPAVQRQAAALSALEMEIANFDQKQRRAALVATPGPQRIRGLAGSGKTVILAMKAANLHLANPEQKILVTFTQEALELRLRTLSLGSTDTTVMKIQTGTRYTLGTAGAEPAQVAYMPTPVGGRGEFPFP